MKIFKEYLMINIGLLLVAFAINYIMVPNNIVAGGVSGFSILINHYLPSLSVGMLMLVMNIFLFVLGFILIGFNFGAKTIYSSLALSGMVWLMDKFFPINRPFTDDILLELIFSSLIGAIGLAIVFNENASTGGTDIIAKILNKYFDIDLGKAMLLADITIATLSIFVFGIKMGMYGILGVFLNGTIIDYLLINLSNSKEIVIISTKSDQIKTFIIDVLDRGATIYSAKGAYTNDEREVIRTIVNKKEFSKLRKFIKTADTNAFITVNDVSKIYGEGFIVL